ncbi:MAG TPA: hypothetical protein VGK74_03680 [Symbiobacteriaceae bacterium]|jgi:hypothetical protein
MNKQTVMWTALPGGRSKGIARLSVFVTPRLESDEGDELSLGTFPDFVDWHNREITYKVKFGGVTLRANVVRASIANEPWPLLFHGGTLVRPFKFEKLDDRAIRSYPSRHIHNFIKEQHIKVGLASPVQPPTAHQLARMTHLGQIAFQAGLVSREMAATSGLGANLRVPTVNILNKNLEDALKKLKAIPFSKLANPPQDFLQLQTFYKPPTIPEVTAPQMDFHEAVASLASYPRLMRDLRLVVDLDVEIGNASLPSSGLLSVIPDWEAQIEETTNVTPFTKFLLTASTFVAEPSDPDLKNGVLDLSQGDSFDIVQIDVAGGALKSMDLANRVVGSVSSGTDQPTDMPIVRTAGLSVTRDGYATKMVQKISKTDTVNNAVPSIRNQAVTKIQTVAEANAFHLEDLIRGYRIDVWDDKSAKWHSLCRRVGTYHFVDDNTSLTYRDEGWVAPAVTGQADSEDLYASEAMFSWSGWSLVAPRPGKAVGLTGDVEEDSDEETPFGISVQFKPEPGSLPKLRYGRKYRFRARAVDLAGNSPDFSGDSQDFSTATPLSGYFRFEPVAAPVVVARTEMKRGESLEHLVIRSDAYGASPDTTERHIAPPRTTQIGAEIHGKFDQADGKMNKSAYQAISARDLGLHTQNDNPIGKIVPDAKLPIYYLPDPLAKGASFRNLPTINLGKALTATLPGSLKKEPRPEVTKVDFAPPSGGAWYDAQPFRLKVIEGKGVTWDQTKRELTVGLQKADVLRVPLSCYMDAPDTAQLGTFQWLGTPGAPYQGWNLAADAQDGLLWQMTPPRELVLINAVRQPLADPMLSDVLPKKMYGDTFATLSGKVYFEGKSTGKVEIIAGWSESVDIPTEAAFRVLQAEAHLCQFDGLDPANNMVTLNQAHNFGDTKHREVSYIAVASTRFAEFFLPPSEPVPTPTKKASHLDVTPITVPKILKLSDVEDMESAVRTSVDKPAIVHILSSAEPAVPKLLYVVPTFEIVASTSGGDITRTRKTGLRIYLDRPWFSSGDGELLGVVFRPGGGTYDTGLDAYITRLGGDPIWWTEPVAATIEAKSFQGAKQIATKLNVWEFPKEPVSVAGYETNFDSERGLWYADVALDSGMAYFPFVRLALVRYQPYSVPGAELSRVVVADFAQLAAERVVSIHVPDPSRPQVLSVTISGPGPVNPIMQYVPAEIGVSSEKTAFGSSPILVSVEQLPPNVASKPNPDENLRWTPVASFWGAPFRSPNGAFNWSVSVTLPAARGSRPFRLVFQEFERFVTGDGSDQTVGTSRVVFADTVII